MTRRARALALLLLPVLLAAAGCSDKPAGPGQTLLVVVNAPFSITPYVGQTIAQGTQIAVDDINKAGGIDTGAGRYRLRIERLDNALSPQRALDNVRQAVQQGAVAIIDEGIGVDASWEVANTAYIPICIVYQGGIGLVDPQTRPNVFRIAPTDRGVSFRLAEYMVPKGYKTAWLTDDTGYGQQGLAALNAAWRTIPEAIAAKIAVPADQSDLSPQVLQAKQSGATALLVWGTSATIAGVVRAARGSGWEVPIYTPPAGEDPFVRQQLSDHPEWVDGLTFASGRMTAERGAGPFLAFQRTYVDTFGPDEVGVKTSKGEPVTQPPDYGMYPYDFVNVLAAAIEAAHGPDGPAVLDALNQVDVRGANGDERGFNEKNHDGVVDDDVYFAVFRDMTYAPVKDDPLSSTLPVISQTG